MSSDLTLEDMKRAGVISRYLVENGQYGEVQNSVTKLLGLDDVVFDDLESEEQASIAGAIAVTCATIASEERITRSRTPDDELQAKALETIEAFLNPEPQIGH